jgi:hypothetical protein
LPDADLACSITNNNNQMPEDIARANEHFELASYFQNRLDKDSFKKIYEIYDSMTNIGKDTDVVYVTSDVRSRMNITGDSDEDGEEYENVLNAFQERNARQLKSKLLTPSTSTNDEPEYISKEIANPYMIPLAEIKADARKTLPINSIHATIPDQTLLNQSECLPSSHSQEELLKIMEQVKLKQITLSDAEILFKEWELQYDNKRNKTFRQKQSQLGQIREEIAAHDDSSFFKKLFPVFGSKKANIPCNSSKPQKPQKSGDHLAAIMPGVSKSPLISKPPPPSSSTAFYDDDSRVSTASSSSKLLHFTEHEHQPRLNMNTNLG